MPAIRSSPNVAVLTLAGLVVIGVAAAMMMLGGPSSGPVLSPDGAIVEPRVASPVDRVVAPIADGRTAPDVGFEDGMGERTAVGAASPLLDGPTLTVVEAVTGRPVPGAEVFFADEGNMRFERRDPRHWADHVLESPSHTVADEAGKAALPIVERRLFVVARTDTLFGVGTVQRGEREATITVEVDRTVRVHVTDLRGRSCADVEVLLAVDRMQRIEPRTIATTDDDGIALLPHVQLHRTLAPEVDPAQRARIEELTNRIATIEQTARLEQVRVGQLREDLRLQFEQARRELGNAGQQPRGRGRRSDPAVTAPAPAATVGSFAEFVVAARVPQLSPMTVRFPADALPETTVELRIGALGALTVELIGPGGKPLWAPCRVELRRGVANPLPGTLEPALVESVRRAAVARRDKPTGDEPVRFDPVGAGVLVDIGVSFPDDDFTFEQAGIAGPFEDEDRVVQIRVPDWFAVLAGRLVDRDGRPIAGLGADLLLSGSAGRIEGESIKTDAEGRFELPFKLPRVTAPYALEVQARFAEAAAGCRVRVGELQPGRRHELGDLIVAELPVLARGTVRNDIGEPVAGANVQLQTFHVLGDGRDAWRDVAYVRAQTDETGAFELYGDSRNERMRIHAGMRGHAQAVSAELTFGSEVDLVLARLGDLVAAGQAPEWLPTRAVQITLSRDGQPVRREELRLRGDRFRLAIGGLEPGVYDLSFALRGVGTIVDLPGLRIAPGERTTVPDLDLRDQVFRYEVRVRNQRGEPVGDPGAPLLAQIVEPTGGLRWVAFPWRGDRVEFFSTGRSAMVVALVPGHRPARSEIAPGESLLTVAQLQPIEIVTPGLRGLVGERRVRISLVFEGDTGLPMADLDAVDQRGDRGRGYQRAALGKSSGAWLGADDSPVQMTLMLNGRYQVVARISEPGKRDNVSKVIGTIDAVLDGRDVQRAVVPVPVAVIQQALIELASR